jgi:DNA-binding protein YbaB
MNSKDTHPQVTETLAEFERFTKALEDQMRLTDTSSYTASDETETVEVTINGHRCVTDVHIEAGLLRMGAVTVEQRINDALSKAQASASEAIQSQQMQLISSLTEITGSLQKSVGLA